MEIKVRTETSPLLTDLVLERKIEGAFVCGPVEHHDLVKEIIFDDELVILTVPEITDLEIPVARRYQEMAIVLGQGRPRIRESWKKFWSGRVLRQNASWNWAP